MKTFTLYYTLWLSKARSNIPCDGISVCISKALRRWMECGGHKAPGLRRKMGDNGMGAMGTTQVAVMRWGRMRLTQRPCHGKEGENMGKEK